MTTPPVDSAAHLAPGTLLDDRYEILRQLGIGGMGTVYLARHLRMDRLCAVKVLHPSLAGDHEALERFGREARNASRINHPAVCAVYDFGSGPGGGAYLAMEYVEGRSLGAILREQGAMAPSRALTLLRGIAAGLDAAHALGIVHRDLKPDNVMVVGSPGGETVKLVDFGIAKALAGDLHREVTAPGVVVGTPDYMAPEQFAGDPADHRIDLYSLAVIAFRMLTGSLPFVGATARETLTARLTTAPRTLSEAAPERPFPPEAQAVMDRALARRPEDRFETATAFADAMGNALSGMPPDLADATPTVRLDAPTGPAGSPSPTLRHRRLPGPGRAIIAVGLAAGILFLVWRQAGLPSPAGSPQVDSAGTTPLQAPAEEQESPGRVAEGTTGARTVPPEVLKADPVPPLPDPDEVLAPETRDASRARAEQIYFRTDADPVVRAQAAFIVAQVQGEVGRFEEALLWVRRAVAVNDSAPAGGERERRADRYRSLQSQIELRRKDTTLP